MNNQKNNQLRKYKLNNSATIENGIGMLFLYIFKKKKPTHIIMIKKLLFKANAKKANI